MMANVRRFLISSLKLTKVREVITRVGFDKPESSIAMISGPIWGIERGAWFRGFLVHANQAVDSEPVIVNCRCLGSNGSTESRPT